jgi:hypothetical protein
MCLWWRLGIIGLGRPKYPKRFRAIVRSVSRRRILWLLVCVGRSFIALRGVGWLTRIGTSIYVSRLMIVRMTNTIKKS